ncbi:hypothetical protein ACX80E_02125 [Arthrobacter sp. TMN-49]
MSDFMYAAIPSALSGMATRFRAGRRAVRNKRLWESASNDISSA